jgi:hypothetical protein
MVVVVVVVGGSVGWFSSGGRGGAVSDSESGTLRSGGRGTFSSWCATAWRGVCSGRAFFDRDGPFGGMVTLGRARSVSAAVATDRVMMGLLDGRSRDHRMFSPPRAPSLVGLT